VNYSLFILKRAQKELSKVEGKDYEKIKKAIIELAYNPRPNGCKKLTGREGWRIRVGNYRVIYEIDEIKRKITIFHIGHRKDVYS